jgi:hypothetical protein
MTTVADDVDGIDAIALLEAKRAVESAGDVPIEDKLLAAMRVTKHHWLLQGEGRQLRAACGAVMVVVGQDSEDGQRIAREHRALSAVSAMITAAQRGVVVAGVTEEAPEHPIGILRLWRSLDEDAAGR